MAIQSLIQSPQPDLDYHGPLFQDSFPKPTRIEPLHGEQTNASFRVLYDQPVIWKVYQDPPTLPSREITIPQVVGELCPTLKGWVTDQEGKLVAVLSADLGDYELWQHQEYAQAALIPVACALGSFHARLQALEFRLHDGSLLRELLSTRLEHFQDCCPQLEKYYQQCQETYRQLSFITVPEQHIHGDLHLGQVFFNPHTKAVSFIDFEGEPGSMSKYGYAPVLDTPMRDLAGLIRSYHYAGQKIDLAALAQAYQKTFAYFDATVLDACLKDRFCYEVVYEQQHRPDWVPRVLATADEVFAFSSEQLAPLSTGQAYDESTSTKS